mgnify:CR=1 FL=1
MEKLREPSPGTQHALPLVKDPKHDDEAWTFWGGVKDCDPTLLGYLSIGIAAGVVGATEGLSMLQIGLLSVFLYAGSAQFIVASMIGAGSSAIAIIGTIFFVNLRHLLLSAAISPLFRQYSWKKNLLLGAQLTDETFAVACKRRIAIDGCSD